MPNQDGAARAARSERWALLRSVDRMLDGPLIVLSFVWLALLVLEFAIGSDARLEVVFYAIWIIFIVEVAIELLVAPDRLAYVRGNWLKVIALLVPALRALRVLNALRFLRAAGAVRSAGMLRLLTSLNRGIAALSRTLDRTRFVYVLALTVLVIIVGSAGLLFFEGPAAARPEGPAAGTISSYGEALWWTGMAMTTVGTDVMPITAEGRLLAWLLSLYAIGVFGYVTATMASHFLGLAQDRPEQREPNDKLSNEVAALRAEIARLARQLETGSQSGGG